MALVAKAALGRLSPFRRNYSKLDVQLPSWTRNPPFPAGTEPVPGKAGYGEVRPSIAVPGRLANGNYAAYPDVPVLQSYFANRPVLAIYQMSAIGRLIL